MRKQAHTKAESTIFLEKGSNFVVKPYDFQTFRFFGEFFFGDFQKLPLFLRLCRNRVRGEDEVRLPCDFKEILSRFALPETKRIFAFD